MHNLCTSHAQEFTPAQNVNLSHSINASVVTAFLGVVQMNIGDISVVEHRINRTLQVGTLRDVRIYKRILLRKPSQ